MAKMGYAQADSIRKKRLSDRIAEKIVSGEGIGESVTKSISEGTKARVTNLKRKFDLMNMVKFATGGSNLAPAIVGKLTGRSKEDMKYFTGKTGKTDTASKIKPMAQENEGIIEILNDIYNLLEDARKDREASKPSEEVIDEKKRDAKKRHDELIKAIMSIKSTDKKETATKVDEEGNGLSLSDMILGALGAKALGSAALKALGSLAAWAVGPVGGLLLGAATVATFSYVMWKMLTDKSGYEDSDTEPSTPEESLTRGRREGLAQAERVGGLAGVKDEMEKRKGLPEYTRTLLELQDAENTFWKDENGNPQFGTDVQLEGYAKRSAEAAAAVEAYKKKRDIIKGVSTKETATSVKPTEQTLPGGETPAESLATPTATMATASTTAAGTATQISGGQTVPAAGTETPSTTMSSAPTATSVPTAKETTSLTPEGASVTPESLSPANVPTAEQKSITSPTLPATVSTGSAAIPAAVAATTSTATQVMSVPKSEMPKPSAAPSVTNTAIPMASVPSSAAVNSAISENLDMNIPINMEVSTQDIVNNSTINTKNEVRQPVGPIPAIRNMEETFQRMILYSTRVV